MVGCPFMHMNTITRMCISMDPNNASQLREREGGEGDDGLRAVYSASTRYFVFLMVFPLSG